MSILVMASLVSAAELKVKLQGSAADSERLPGKLNENGKERGLSFVTVDTNFQYRIAIYGEGRTTGDFFTGGGADAAAAVLTPDCDVLFIVSRGGRSTKGGALNALSKDIVKKLKEQPWAKTAK